jgi:glyoxylase-like metal-dependent hydrolase (beta-lactamase superfamily II)
MELVAVGPDLFACLQPDDGLGASNSGLIARDGGFVVDTFWDLPRTRRLVELYATRLDAPARRVLNTHHNGDHCWGNQLFADAGAEIIGHRLCVEWFTKEATPELFVALCESDDESLPPSLGGFVRSLRKFDFHDIVLTPPTTAVDGDTTIDLDGLQVDLLYVGPAHTPGDVVVHVPEHGVLYTGDILFHECTPIGWEGTFANWIAALDRIVALAPETIVPGHGPLATVDGVLGLKAYLEYVYREAKAGYEAGLTTLEAASGIELGPYAGWTEPERLAFQVDRAYRELSGVPWDTPVDTGKVFAEVAALKASRTASPSSAPASPSSG